MRNYDVRGLSPAETQSTRLSLPGTALLAMLLVQFTFYGTIYVFSEIRPYTFHIVARLDRLTADAAPLAVLLMVGCIVAVAAGRVRERVVLPVTRPAAGVLSGRNRVVGPKHVISVVLSLDGS